MIRRWAMMTFTLVLAVSVVPLGSFAVPTIGLNARDGNATSAMTGKVADGLRAWTDTDADDDTSYRFGTAVLVGTGGAVTSTWSCAVTWYAGTAANAEQQLYYRYLDDGDTPQGGADPDIAQSGDGIGAAIRFTGLQGWLTREGCNNYVIRVYRCTDTVGATFRDVGVRVGTTLAGGQVTTIGTDVAGLGDFPTGTGASYPRGYGDSTVLNDDSIVLAVPARNGSARGTLSAVKITATTLSPDDYAKSSRITFTGYDGGRGTLTNFPVLVQLSTNITGFSYAAFASTNGYDLRFTDSDGTTLVNHEIELWDTNGVSTVWVQIPELAGDGTDCVYAYWGNTNITRASVYTTNGSTWASQYAAVWHFSPADDLEDSTVNGNDGTNAGTTDAAGIAGRARYFDGSAAEIAISDVKNTLGAGEGAMSFWLRTSSTINGGQSWNCNALVGDDQSAAAADSWWGLLDQGKVGVRVANSGACMSTSTITDNQWRHVVLTRNATSGQLQTFVDGALETAVARDTGNLTGNTLATLGRNIDGGTSGGHVIGNFDEVRVSGAVPTADWVWAEYMAGAQNTTLMTYSGLPAYWDTSTAAGLQPGNGTWDNETTAAWSDSLDGSDPLLFWHNGIPAIAHFTTNGTSTVTVSGVMNAGGLVFDGTGYTLGGGTITLGADGIVANESATVNSAIAVSGDQAWSAASGKTLSAGGARTGSADLTIIGPGAVTMTARSAAFAGDTIVDGGTLTLNAANGADSIVGSGTLRVNAGATVNCYVNAFGYTQRGPVVVDGGTLRQVNTDSHLGLVTLHGGTMSGATFQLDNGSFAVQAADTASTISAAPVNLQTTVNFNVEDGSPLHDLIVSGNLAAGGGLTKTGAGSMRLCGNDTYSGITTISDGRLAVDHDAATGSGEIRLNGGTFALDTAGLLEGGAAGSQTDSTTPNPGTDAELSTAMINTGSGWPGTAITYIYNGTLVVTNTSEVTWTFGEHFDDFVYLKIDGNVVLNNNQWNVHTHANCTLTPGEHSLEVRGGDGGGGVGPQGSFATAGFGVGYDPQGRGSSNGADYLPIADPGDGSFLFHDMTISDALTMQADSGIEVLGGGTATLTGIISGPGRVSTSGGTLILTATNTYYGGTTIGAGLVLANTVGGSALGTADVTIDGGTLGGTGLVGANVGFGAGGGTVAPGVDGVGTLTIDGDAVFTADAAFDVELEGASAYDALSVTGSVVLGNAALNVTFGYVAAANDTLFIIDNDGTDAVSGTFAGLPEGATLSLGTYEGTEYTCKIGYAGDSATGAVEGGNDVVLYDFAIGNLPYRMKIVFNGYTGVTPLTNFPALVTLSEAHPGFSYDGFASAQGYDLRFTDADGVRVLNYERELFDNAGTSYLWVQVPVLTNGATIWAYWGNTAETTLPDYCTDGSTWSEGFVGVYHLGETGAALTYADSSPEGNDLTSVAAPAEAVGKIVGCRDFTADNADQPPRISSPGGGLTLDEVSVMVWVNLASGTTWRDWWGIEAGAGNHLRLELDGETPGKCNIYQSGITGANAIADPNDPVEDGNWHLLAFTGSSSANQAKIYVDGVQDGSTVAWSAVAAATGLKVGASWATYANAVGGRIDEARFAKTARSADWIRACYATMNSPETFAVYNGELNPADYGRRIKIEFAGYTKPETLTNFPALVKLSTDIAGFTYDDFASANGYDLRFTDSDGVTVIPHEIEYWDNTATSFVWVAVPALEGTGSDYVWAYWANAAETTPAVFSTNGATWANNYAGVWHFPDSDTFADSSANGNDGTDYGTTHADTSLHGGRYFNGTSARIALTSDLQPALGVGGGSLSFWIKTDSIIDNGSGWNCSCFLGQDNDYIDLWWGVTANNQVGIRIGDTAPLMSSSTITDDLWRYVTLTRDADTGVVQVFMNGVLEGTATFAAGSSAANNDLDEFGRNRDGANGGWVKGNFDEIRAVDTVRSSNWVWACWMNQGAATHNTFVDYKAVPLYWDTDVAAGLQGGDGTWDDATTPSWSRVPGGNDPLETWNNGMAPVAVFQADGPATITVSGTITNSGITLNGADHVFTGGTLTLGEEGITVNATGTVNSALVLSDDQAWTVAAAAELTVAGAVDNGAHALTVAASGPTALSGNLTGGGALLKTGEGMLTLSGTDNSYAGGTTVSEGTLVVAGGGWKDHYGAGTGTIAIGDDGTLVASGAHAFGATDPCDFAIAGGTLTLNAESLFDQLTMTGGVIGGAGVLRLTNSPAITTLAAAQAATITAPVALHAATVATVADGAAAADLAIGGAISGTYALTKTGDGVLQLTGANSYAGGTTIDAGRLCVCNTTGSGVGVGDVLISGGELGGNGTLGSVGDACNVAFDADGGGINPGTGAGNLTVYGNVNFTSAGSSRFDVELDGPLPGVEYDRLTVNGGVTLGGAALNVTINYTPRNSEKLFILVNDGTDPIGGTFAGLAEGDQITAETSGGVEYQCRIGYHGDSATGALSGGNDVVLYDFGMDPFSFEHRVRIGFPEYTHTTPLTNFPVLVRLSGAIPSFDYGEFGSANGYDLRFTDGDGVSVLNHEIETWSVGGESTVWVQVPVLTNGASIWAYWGNSGITTPAAYTTDGSTWDASYLGVWHFADPNGGLNAVDDSTAHHNHGTDVSLPAFDAAGVIGPAIEFYGTGEYIDLPNLGTQSLATVECWFKGDDFSSIHGLVAHAQWLPGSVHFDVRTDDLYAHLNGGGLPTEYNQIAVGNWYYGAYTFEGAGLMRLYRDGVERANAAGSGQPTILLDEADVGTEAGDRYFDGLIDEVRVSTVARSADWIWACYMNYRQGSTFLDFAPVQEAPVIETLAATSVDGDRADANANVSSTGGVATTVYVYWGETDEGAVKGAWAHTNVLGVCEAGAVVETLTPLAERTTYYYRFYASNAYHDAWADTSESFTSWYTPISKNDFSKAMRITFSGYTRATPLTNFPVLVKLDASIPGFSYDDFTSPGGLDLRFTDTNGTTVLAYEVEHWDTAGASYVWVRVPLLEGTGEDYIWAYWGNRAVGRSPADIAGCKLWLRADAIAGLNDGDTVNTWPDSSGNGNNATRVAGTPLYKPGILNGQPVVRFNGGSGDHHFQFSSVTGIRTIIWVLNEDAAATASWRSPLSGTDGPSDQNFHRGASKYFWSPAYGAPEVYNGQTFINGVSAGNGQSTVVPTEKSIVTLVTTGATQADRLATDRASGGRSWWGDMAEVIIYDRVLTADEAVQVYAYLARKYGIRAGYASPEYADNGMVWSEGYAAVWHLDEAIATHNLLDSTLNGHDGVNTDAADTTGFAARGRAFNGTSAFVDSGATLLNNADRFTLSGWVNPAGFAGTTGLFGQNDAVEFGLNGSGQVTAWTVGSGGVTGAALTTGGWYYITLLRDVTNLRLYYDGVLNNSGARGSAATSAYSLKLGGGVWSPTGQFFNGTMDEVRVSTIDRGADWVWAEWMNMAGNTTFQTYGAVSHVKPASEFIIR